MISVMKKQLHFTLVWETIFLSQSVHGGREEKRCLTKKSGYGILLYRSKPAKPIPLGGPNLIVYASYRKNTIHVKT